MSDWRLFAGYAIGTFKPQIEWSEGDMDIRIGLDGKVIWYRWRGEGEPPKYFIPNYIAMELVRRLPGCDT